MSDQITMTYDAATKRAVLKFPNGRELKVSNLTEEQAQRFLEQHAPEFGKRDCVLHTAGGIHTRSDSHG